MVNKDEAQQIAAAKKKVHTFWTRDGSGYDNAEHHGINSPEEQEKWVDIFTRLIPPNSKIIDVGAGTGFCSIILTELGHKVTALDWSKEMLDHALAKAKDKNVEFETVVADIEDTGLESASFEVLTARHVLWTLLEPEIAIKEWARLLKPGGIAVVDISLGMHGAHYEADIEELLPMRLVESATAVEQLFRSNGFASAESTTTPSVSGHSRPHVVIKATR